MANTHLIISTSNELLRIAASHIVCIKSDGNYSYIHQPGNEAKLVAIQLGKLEEKIREQLPEIGHNFVRVGKSLIVNVNYIYNINLSSQKIILIDEKFNRYEDNASKEALKILKEKIEQRELQRSL